MEVLCVFKALIILKYFLLYIDVLQSSSFIDSGIIQHFLKFQEYLWSLKL